MPELRGQNLRFEFRAQDTGFKPERTPTFSKAKTKTPAAKKNRRATEGVKFRGLNGRQILAFGFYCVFEESGCSPSPKASLKNSHWESSPESFKSDSPQPPPSAA